MKRLITQFFLLVIILPISYAQPGNCNTIVLDDDFSSDAGWTTQGDGSIEISNGSCNLNSVTGRKYNRVYKNLGRPLSDNYWKAECEFSILSSNPPGSGSNGVPLVLTAGSLPFISYDNSQNFQETDQDAIGVVLFSNSTRDNNIDNWYFLLEGKKGTVRSFDLSTGIFAKDSIRTYYIRLERMALDTARLSVFTDSLFLTHLPGSPSIFAIDSSITDLNTIQHGGSTPATDTRRIDAKIDNDFICEFEPITCSTELLADDFTTPTDWQVEGDSSVSVSNGFCKLTSTGGRRYNRIYRTLDRTLSDTYWKAETDFSILSTNPVGSGSSGIPLVLTAGNLPFISYDASQNFLETTQDAIGVVLFSNSTIDNNIDNWYFLIEGKKGNVRSFDLNTGIFAQSSIRDYFLRLERTSLGTAMLSVFIDSSFSTHLAGSPAIFEIDSTITGLNTIQHGISTPAALSRRINARIDNDFICDDALVDGIFEFSKASYLPLSIYPNPAKDHLKISHEDPSWNPSTYSYSLFNLLGEQIDTNVLDASALIDISFLNTGLYLLGISNGKKRYWARFQKE